jgi:hypothetical protein
LRKIGKGDGGDVLQVILNVVGNPLFTCGKGTGLSTQEADDIDSRLHASVPIILEYEVLLSAPR